MDSLTISVESEGVGVVESRAGRQRCSSGVAITQVFGAWAIHSRSVGFLMERGSCLILAVTGARKGRKRTEEKRAVGDEF